MFHIEPQTWHPNVTVAHSGSSSVHSWFGNLHPSANGNEGAVELNDTLADA